VIVCGDKAGFVLEDYEDYGPKTGPESPQAMKNMRKCKCKKGGKRK
jgi:hypothetical protein